MKDSLDQIPHGYIALDPEKYPAINNRGNLTTKQLALLAAAEEAYSGAASVLRPAVRELLEDCQVKTLSNVIERLGTGLHLLEEAMARHNAYMESLK